MITLNMISLILFPYFTAATILGAHGIPVVCHVVPGSVSDIGLAPTLCLNMVETTALHWDQVLRARAVTATHVQVRYICLLKNFPEIESS